jgi:hypothetical protein
MDDHKVKAIVDWEPPKSVLAFKSFLRLASYYRKFIRNFAKIAAPLTNLLKKSVVTYEWECRNPSLGSRPRQGGCKVRA